MEKDKSYYEITYGPGITDECEAIKLCLEKVALIKAVIDIKGMGTIETYLYSRLQDIHKNER